MTPHIDAHAIEVIAAAAITGVVRVASPWLLARGFPSRGLPFLALAIGFGLGALADWLAGVEGSALAGGVIGATSVGFWELGAKALGLKGSTAQELERVKAERDELLAQLGGEP